MNPQSFQIQTASFEDFYEKAPHMRGIFLGSEIVQLREIGV